MEIKEIFQQIINRKYACHLLYDKLSIYACALGLQGMKRIYMRMSEENWCDYVYLKNKYIKRYADVIYPDMKYSFSILDFVLPVVNPLEMNNDVVKKALNDMLNGIRKYERESQSMIGESLSSIEHNEPKSYKELNEMTFDNTRWIEWANKCEQRYDRYGWDMAFIAQDQKRIHDLEKSK